MGPKFTTPLQVFGREIYIHGFYHLSEFLLNQLKHYGQMR